MSATAAMGSLMYLKYYLEYRGIDIESTNNNKQTPLICACDWGHPEAVKFLIEKGANVNARDARGRTALMYFDYDNPEITKLLINANADVNAKDHAGYTALMHAYMQNHIKIMKLLKSHGAFKMSQDANFDKWLLENSSLIKEIKEEQDENRYEEK
jgi:ankyrin repeat protein